MPAEVLLLPHVHAELLLVVEMSLLLLSHGLALHIGKVARIPLRLNSFSVFILFQGNVIRFSALLIVLYDPVAIRKVLLLDTQVERIVFVLR